MAQPTQEELLKGIKDRLAVILKQTDPIPFFQELIEKTQIDLHESNRGNNVDVEDYVIQQLIRENRDNSLDFYWFRFKMDYKNKSFLESIKENQDAA